MTRKQREAAAKAAAEQVARDLGRDLFRDEPEALLIAVARKAATLFIEKRDQLAYLEGYKQARQQNDDYLKEHAR